MIFRTRPQTGIPFRALLGAAIAVLVLIPLAALAGLALLALSNWLIGWTARGVDETPLGAMLWYLIFSPLASLWGVLAGLLPAWLAVRLGWAGLGTAVLAAAALGALAGATQGESDMPVILGLVGALFALPFWLGARWFDPRIGGVSRL